jgi:hypothetical protein
MIDFADELKREERCERTAQERLRKLPGQRSGS